MSFQPAENGLLPNALAVKSPTVNASAYDESNRPSFTIVIGTSSSAHSIMMPWKKSVQHTALYPPRNV